MKKVFGIVRISEFRFRMARHILAHDLAIFGKCRSVCATHFVDAESQQRMHFISSNFKLC